MKASPDEFPSSAAGLPESRPPEILELDDGDELRLHVAPVAKRLGDAVVRMLAYNGSVPGPTLRVRQGSEVAVEVVNEGDLETTVHWHGLRLENRYDGTHLTQSPIPVGGRFAYRLTFPDPGVYWYHPHVREDYGQEMGLYGNIVVVPSEPDYWAAADRELVLALDDVLVEDGRVAPFSQAGPTHVAMGRFGNVLLVNGEPGLSLAGRRGELVRLYLTNTANTRVFDVGLRGARMKLVGGDSGRCEREQMVESVVIAPSERAVVEALLDRPGRLDLEHRTPDRVYPLATIHVEDDRPGPSRTSSFATLRTNAEMLAERARLVRYLDAAPEKTLALVAEMDVGAPHSPGEATYFCPMDADVTSEHPGRCPRCGMKLLAREAPGTYVCPMHPAVRADKPGRCPECGMKLLEARTPGPPARTAGPATHEPGHAPAMHEARHAPATHEALDRDRGGIEWEDEMVEVNRATTAANTRWKLVDRATGAEGASIDWRFRVGDRVKIRLVNEMDSDHPMQHPFHVHGAGRFLVLSRGGAVEPNLVWKDTVLVRTGQTVDILLDVTNPGSWMAHCHIAEHHEGGMMLRFEVDP